MTSYEHENDFIQIFLLKVITYPLHINYSFVTSYHFHKVILVLYTLEKFEETRRSPSFLYSIF